MWGGDEGARVRDEFEDEVISEDLGIERGADEVVDDPLHHVRGVGLARVDARRDDDPLALSDRLGVRGE